MIPLTTRQGLTASEITALIGGRDVLIWGKGDLAQDVLTSLRKTGIQPKAFLHSNPSEIGACICGLPVRSPTDILAQSVNSSRSFTVLATVTFRKQAEAACLNAGWKKDVDFLSHLSIPRPHAIIEVANDCPLRCLGCPRHTNEHLSPPAVMEASVFHRVLAKLSADLPLLCHLDLALWGEPLLNPELPEIIRAAEGVVPCTVSSSLVGNAPLEQIIAAEPSRFDITAFGFGKSYELAMLGSSWDAFVQRLSQLRLLIAKHRPHTRFLIRVYRTRHDSPRIQEKWVALLKDSGIGLSIQTPYLMPYDHVLAYCETGNISTKVRSTMASLPWEMNQILEACVADANLPCLSQRVFPVINADVSVALCHLYYQPIIATDYLSISWNDLLCRRHKAMHCQHCQRFGLHRLDLDVLARRHPNKVGNQVRQST